VNENRIIIVRLEKSLFLSFSAEELSTSE